VDEELKQETEEMVRGGGPTHTEDFRDAEAVDPEEQRDIDREVARAVDEGRDGAE
jgi:hypothetical protein